MKSEMFNQFPGTVGSRIVGAVEVRGLVNFLLLPKPISLDDRNIGNLMLIWTHQR